MSTGKSHFLVDMRTLRSAALTVRCSLVGRICRGHGCLGLYIFISVTLTKTGGQANKLKLYTSENGVTVFCTVRLRPDCMCCSKTCVRSFYNHFCKNLFVQSLVCISFRQSLVLELVRKLDQRRRS